MNDIIKNMMERRTCRSYTEEMVKEEELDQVLEAGEWAPSGMGQQPTILVAVQKPELIKKLSEMNAAVMGTKSNPFYGASTAIVVFADSNRPTFVEDGALVMGNMLNAAHSLGLGSCWVHRAREVFSSEEGKALKAEWGVPESYEGIAHCILGYPASPTPAAKPRREGRIKKVF